MIMRTGFGVAAALLTGIAALSAAQAQSFSDKPMTLIVPLAAGSTTDVSARLLAQYAAKPLGATIIVENRPGAGTVTGAAYVAKAPPDGHTLLMGTIAMAVASNLYKNVPYDPLKDFAPVTLAITAPLVLTISPAMGVQSVAELLGKFKDKDLTFSSGGAGTLPHLAGELFKAKSGLKLTHIPYRGGGPAFSDVVAGHVNMMFATPLVKQNIDNGDVRALAVTGSKRVATLPNVPTFQEAGLALPEIDYGAWFGIFAPAGTPRDIVERLNREFNAALKVDEVQAKLQEIGLAAHGSTPEEFGKLIAAETQRWPPIFKAAGIVAE
jgi:tripartite-type tricarboxylate transporter receptor subunit TctC